ncbi:MAG: methyltransferase domain-containing protein [Anaerolineales bacterium]|nr:methyltransferase domain-containing protein [Anaerolineales bacterium]
MQGFDLTGQTLALFMLQLIARFMRVFFALLYHPFAFTYDLVAAVVSFGCWKDWTKTVLPYIEGARVLELGFGPGHLQRILLSRGLFAVGLDESRQMAVLAKNHLSKSGYTQIRLSRGLAQQLPFPNESFNTVVATFPTEYIFDPRTLAEVRRCLLNGGRLVVLPVAWPKSPLLAWLYKVTGESPSAIDPIIQRVKPIFANAGFDVRLERLEEKSSRLLIIIATKTDF